MSATAATAQDLLQRYRDLIDDPVAFEACMARPVPTCVWANPAKASPEAVAGLLRDRGIPFEPLAWYPNAFRSREWAKPGATIAFAAGWYNVQEEISLAAVQALDPQPGERVLDLCAAPGGKTIQIAARLAGTGTVVANEAQVARMASLRAMLDRMGALNVAVTNSDGRHIPLPPQSFDRVLVDAPCSGEGSTRKVRAHWRGYTHRYSRRIAVTQRKLLERALQLVKPGGVVVYSTCTFAPEENEAPIDAVLGDRGQLESAAIPQLRGMAGLHRWDGQSFRADLARAQRYFPHFNDTGGFFVARIRRSAAEQLESALTADGAQSPLAPLAVPEAWHWFGERFGLARADVPPLQFWHKGSDKVWMTDAACQPPAQPPVQTLGLPLVRCLPVGYKPTTSALQRLGPHIDRNAIALADAEQAQRFLLAQPQTLAATGEPGYVHVRYGPYELGCGSYKQGVLHSQMPKNLRTSINLDGSDAA